MKQVPQDQVTQLLLEWGSGDRAALDKLMPLVHQELKRLARYHMQRERREHTLQTTALVNEAYLRMVDYNRMSLQDRAHFMGVAAQAMRRVLVDHARKRQFAKRGGAAFKVSLDQALEEPEQKAADLIALDDALIELGRIDPRKAQVVELRYFAGLDIDETAEALGVSPATVQRDWSTARAWLHREIGRG